MKPSLVFLYDLKIFIFRKMFQMNSDTSWSDSSVSSYRPVARKRLKPKKPKNIALVEQEISLNSSKPKITSKKPKTRKLYKDSQDQTALSEDMWNF